MSRYIDELKCAREIRDALNIPMGFVLTTLENVPTADAVEIVRCKDCKYSRVIKRFRRCEHPNDATPICSIDDMHYCSYGERREE